eukprot:GFUD01022281.1.p1 GENE.GFUD01022281.1~~GFUD01022281.1.p1  ORF type:complete len:269 (+),score=76.03 GFUD01022281.1:59-865(+)
MERLPTFRRHSISHGQKLDSYESESLLGSQASDVLELEGFRPKKRGCSTSSFKSKNQTLECDIQPSDTLISLAFKYRVQVAELKRVNNILSDAEFFALKKIKIPVHPTSLLTEILPGDPAGFGVYDNNNGWKVENKESPNKSLFSISVTSEQSSHGGSEADTEGLLSPNMREGKQKKMVKKMLKEVDEDLDLIRIKQVALENVIKENESMEQVFMSTSRFSGAVSASNRSSFKLACLCAFMVVGSLVVMGGLVTMISIKHDEVEVGEW